MVANELPNIYTGEYAVKGVCKLDAPEIYHLMVVNASNGGYKGTIFH